MPQGAKAVDAFQEAVETLGFLLSRIEYASFAIGNVTRAVGS